MKVLLVLVLFSFSLFANFFVLDRGKIVEIVNEPSPNVKIVGTDGRLLKHHKTLASAKRAKLKSKLKAKKRYKKAKRHKSIAKNRIKKRYYKRKKYHKKIVKKRNYKRYTKKRKIYKKVVKKYIKKRKPIKDLIVIRSSKKILEFYKNGRFKKLYKVAVGKPGWGVYGTFRITKKVKWPDWIPTKRIKEENPKLPDIVPGGPKNPLGPRAMYLGNSAIRIHGTNNPKSVGKAVSHGCFRMKNKDVIELFNMVKIGTPVYVK